MTRALRTAASALVVGLVAAGCGSSGTAASPAASSALGTSTTAEAPSLAAHLSEIDGNLVTLDSDVTTSTTAAAGGGTATITTVHHGDDRAKTVVGLRANETITTVTVGDDTWVRADLEFWIRVIDPFGSADGAAKAAPLADRWVLVTDTATEDVGANEDRVPPAHPDDTKAQGSTTLDGTTVCEDPVALTTVYVSQTEPRLPLRSRARTAGKRCTRRSAPPPRWRHHPPPMWSTVGPCSPTDDEPPDGRRATGSDGQLRRRGRRNRSRDRRARPPRPRRRR